MEIDEQIVAVELWSAQKEKKQSCTNCIVEVNGPPEVLSNINTTYLKSYFKNEARSGGGTILGFTIEDGTAYITYETEKGINTVIKVN